jgi:hypothetical protein
MKPSCQIDPEDQRPGCLGRDRFNKIKTDFSGLNGLYKYPPIIARNQLTTDFDFAKSITVYMLGIKIRAAIF